jgi:hypothetical protein
MWKSPKLSVAPEELNFVVKGSSQKAEWLSWGIQAVVSALSDCFLRLRLEA